MFNRKLRATTLAASLFSLGLGTGLGPTAVQADGDEFTVVINDEMPRRPPGSTSGSGHTVEDNCPIDPSGNAWQGATAKLRIEQNGDSSVARIKVKNAVPDTVFTVWMRMEGAGPDGSLIGPSPMTGGGATPLAPGSALDDMIHYTPPFAGSSNPTNGFVTDSKGDGKFTIALDFPVVGGAYPFQRASAQAVADWQAERAANGQGPAPGERKPSPIVNPADPDISGPFLLRVISHCTDQLGHGLSPATREAWFQYP